MAARELPAVMPSPSLDQGRWVVTYGSVLISRLPRYLGADVWRGNRCNGTAFVSDSRLLFQRNGLRDEQPCFCCGGVWRLTTPNPMKARNVSDDAARRVWDDACTLLVNPADLLGTVVSKQRFADGPLSEEYRFAQSVFRCGSRLMHFQPEYVTLAIKATGADAALASKSADNPHVLFTRGGKPVALAIGMLNPPNGQGPELVDVPRDAAAVPLWSAFLRPDRMVRQ